MRAVLAVAAALLAMIIAPAAALADCEPHPGWATSRQDQAAEVVRLVNEHRASAGLPPLGASVSLTKAALWKARHMARYDYFDHDDPAPPVARTWSDRMTACGATGAARAENIAYGQRTAAEVMEGWLDSPGHRANIESTQYGFIGVGAATSAAGVTYWAQTFSSAEQDGGPNPPPVPRADAVTTREDTAAQFAVLANDSDDAAEWLHVAAVDLARAAPVGAGSAVGYRPAPNFSGPESLRYQVVDLLGQVATGTVEVRVDAVNDPPVAANDRVRVRRNRTKRFRPAANDADIDGGRLSVTGIVTRPRHGKARVLDDGRVSYRPRPRFLGADSLVYEVSDGAGGRASGTVDLRVRRR